MSNRILLAVIFLFFISIFNYVQSQFLWGVYKGPIVGSYNKPYLDKPARIKGEAVITIFKKENYAYAYLKYKFSLSTTMYKGACIANSTVTANIGSEPGDRYTDDRAYGLEKFTFEGKEYSTSNYYFKDSSFTISDEQNVKAEFEFTDIDYETGLVTFSGWINITGRSDDMTFRLLLKGRPKNLESMCPVVLERGTMKILREGKEEIITTEKAILRIGDKIITGPDTRVNLIFPDGSTFRIKSNTELTLDNEQVHLKVGKAIFHIEKSGRRFVVKTPSLVCGVSEDLYNIHLLPYHQLLLSSRILLPAHKLYAQKYLTSDITKLISNTDKYNFNTDSTSEISVNVLVNGDEIFKILKGQYKIKLFKTGEEQILYEGDLFTVHKDGTTDIVYFDPEEEKFKENVAFNSSGDEPVKTEEIDEPLNKDQRKDYKTKFFTSKRLKIIGAVLILVFLIFVLVYALYITFRKKRDMTKIPNLRL